MENEVDDIALEAAFNEGSTGEAIKEQMSPTATPDKPEQVAQPVAEVVAPKYAQITEDELNDLKARAAKIDEIKATQEKSFGTAFGKIGGIERVLQQLQAMPTLGELSQDDFVELKEQFPELAEMQVKGLNRALAKLKATAPAAGIDPLRVEELVQERIGTAMQKAEVDKRAEQVTALDADHPDWRELVAKPEFEVWKATQPTRFQKTFSKTWDADFLSDAFADFKASLNKPKPAAAPAPVVPQSTRKDRLAAAVNPRGTGGHAPGPSEDDDFNAGFNSGR